MSMRWLISVTAWERASLWRRIPCAFGRVALLIALLIGLGAELGPPLTISYIVRREAKELPWINVAPQPLKDYSVSDAPGTTLSYFGYSFEVPWNAPFNAKAGTENSSTSGIVGGGFTTGQGLVIIAPADQSGLFSQITHDKSLGMENVGMIFGGLTKLSAYDQYSALLNMTPSKVRAFGPRADAIRAQMLLMFKGIALPSGLQTGAFSFKFPNKRGFQIGDPRKSRRIDLEVLDLAGHYVEIVCIARKDVQLTQPELNRILSSLQMVPVHPTEASTSAARGPRN